MEEKEILKSVADTIVGKPVEFEVDILKSNWITKLLIMLKIKKPKKKFVISPITLGSLIKISKELIDIDMKIFDRHNVLESNYQLIERYTGKMARIAAIGIVNNKDDPAKALINFFIDNLTTKELFTLVSVILEQMDIANFMNTIITIKGVNVLAPRNVSATRASSNVVSL